jgi:hypothetical protein
MGSMTGRGAGNCAGGQNRGKAKTVAGKNAAGRGQCGWFNASDMAGGAANDPEVKQLMEQADALRRQLAELDSKISAMKK